MTPTSRSDYTCQLFVPFDNDYNNNNNKNNYNNDNNNNYNNDNNNNYNRIPGTFRPCFVPCPVPISDVTHSTKTLYILYILYIQARDTAPLVGLLRR